MCENTHDNNEKKKNKIHTEFHEQKITRKRNYFMPSYF